MDIIIKEQSWPAKWAAFFLRKKTMAIVIGHTIHLWNASFRDFCLNEKWKRHELAHVRQFEQYGLVTFMLKYIGESMIRGYTKNKFEVEAREKENGLDSLEMVNFICRKK